MVNNLNLWAARSNAFRLLLENQWVRVLELNKNSGQDSLVRNNQNVNIFYVYKDSKCKLSFPDGSDSVLKIKAQQTVRIELNSKNLQHLGKIQVPNLVIEMYIEDRFVQ